MRDVSSSFIHVCLEQLPRAVQLGLDGSFRDAGHVGDLAVFVAFHIVQHEDGARIGRQFPDGAFQVDVRLVRAGAGRGLESGDVVRGKHPLCPPFLVAHVVQTDVDRDAPQPGRELGLAPERVQLLPEANENVLRHVPGQRLVVRHAAGESVDPPRVFVVQCLEGGRIAAARPFDGRVHSVRASSLIGTEQ